MSDMPSVQEIDWLAQTMARRMLADAASPARADQRLRAVRDWLPAECLTDAQAEAVSAALAKRWQQLAGAVQTRLEARMARGDAKPLRGCEGRV